MNQLADKRAIVVGASRGLGKGVAEAFLAEGASVVAVARDPSPLAGLAARHPLLRLAAGDASDPVVAGRLLGEFSPDIVALVAGATRCYAHFITTHGKPSPRTGTPTCG